MLKLKSVLGTIYAIDSDKIIKVTALATISLPDATTSGYTGLYWCIDNASGVEILVEPLIGGQLIQGEASQPIPDDSSLWVYCDGTGFRLN